MIVFNLIIAFLLLVSSSSAFASFTIPADVDMSMTAVQEIMAIVVTALFVMWGLRKFVKTTNRS